MDDYLSKPLQPAEIHRVLRRFAGGSSQASEPRDAKEVSPEDQNGLSPLTAIKDHLRGIYNFGDEQINRLLKTALSTITDDLAGLAEALDNKDGDQVAARAHKLKGSLVMLGLEETVVLAMSLEQGAQSLDMAQLRELAGRLAGELEQILSQVDMLG
jgi:HPt (histidine-containing phosphotransfer) domain-containing protein